VIHRSDSTTWWWFSRCISRLRGHEYIRFKNKVNYSIWTKTVSYQVVYTQVLFTAS